MSLSAKRNKKDGIISLWEMRFIFYRFLGVTTWLKIDVQTNPFTARIYIQTLTCDIISNNICISVFRANFFSL